VDAPAERLSGTTARKGPIILLIAAVTLVVVLGAGVWALLQEPPSPSVRLASGEVLHLKGVDYGKRHVLREQKLWQQLFGPVLPESLRGREIIRGSSPQERLTLWFQPESNLLPWYMNRRLEAVDEHGCPFDGGYEMGLIDNQSLPYRRGSLLLFPRRSASFRLRLVEREASGSAAELTLANPKPSPHPNWQPESVPVDRRAGGLQVRLLSLIAGMTRETLLRGPGEVQEDGDAPFPAAWRTKSWARAAFRISKGGRPTDRWQLAHLTVSDATGNLAAYPEFEIRSLVTTAAGGGAGVAPGTRNPSRSCIHGMLPGTGGRWIAFPSLCVRESAWKLRALLSYVGPPEGRPADLSWEVPGVPVARPHQQTDTIALRDWPGVRLKLIAVSGRGAWGAEKLDDPASP
jgi:hypothetical protein